MDNNKIGKFIADIRKEKGMTQKELGEKLFVTDKAVSKWERGLSLPDITILEGLAKELDLDISEILNGKRGKNEKIDVQEEIDKAIENIKKEQKEYRVKIVKYCILIVVIIIVTIGIYKLISQYNNKYYPQNITSGDNNYKLGNYKLEEEGLDKLEEIVKKSNPPSNYYNVSYFDAYLNKDGTVKTFTLSLNYFDDNWVYIGRGGYTYRADKLSYSYITKEKDGNTLLVESYSKNNNIKYVSEKLKKVPITEQIQMSSLKFYKITYSPNTKLESMTAIFDGRDNKEINALSKEDYKQGKGGRSKEDYYFVIRLYDGSSMISEEQYLYVFDTIAEDNPENPSYMMQTDYYIDRGTLKFTRDYGRTWIDAKADKEELEKTLDFYRSNSLLPNSWFLSTNELIPIAYFYGENPILKISNDNGKTWIEQEFGSSWYTKRVVGFTSQNFGYVALGTDWTMGSGESKKIYFTYDGGKTWEEVESPENGTSHILYDLCMYDEKVGVIAIRDNINSQFPILYSTVSGGKTWTKVNYRDSNFPEEVNYLTDIDKITKDTNGYNILMGQGGEGTLKVGFSTGDLVSWSFRDITRENIHTVG